MWQVPFPSTLPHQVRGGGGRRVQGAGNSGGGLQGTGAPVGLTLFSATQEPPQNAL